MKRLSTLLCLVLLTTACFSQNFAQTKSVSRFTSELTGADSSTVTNAVTENQIVKVAKPSAVLQIQVTVRKVSGTTGGVVRLFGSNDRLAWKRITATGSLAATDSLNVANVTAPQTIFFKDAPSNYLFYRVSLQQTGTAVSRLVSTAVSAQ